MGEAEVWKNKPANTQNHPHLKGWCGLSNIYDVRKAQKATMQDKRISLTGIRTRAFDVRNRDPNQLDYEGRSQFLRPIDINNVKFTYYNLRVYVSFGDSVM